jgi:uncharacterized membrane protein
MEMDRPMEMHGVMEMDRAMETHGAMEMDGAMERRRHKEMDRLLSWSILFSCLLVVFRVFHTGRLTFLFLIWNLFLAYVPYLISGWLYGKRGRMNRKSLLVILSLVWLVTIPNAFYILTDLYHLGDGYNDRQVPQWFDLVMILSFAWNGLFLGILSVRHMEKLLAPRREGAGAERTTGVRGWMGAERTTGVRGWMGAERTTSVRGWMGAEKITGVRGWAGGYNWRSELLFVYPVMWLNSLGVYTGRYLRYNSWEIVSNPFRLLGDIAGMVMHPLRHQYAWDMIFCFSILMTLMYLMMKRISKTLA